MYKRIIKPSLFLLSPEKSHHFVFSILDFIAKTPLGYSLLKKSFSFSHINLRRTVAGIDFPNPVGLAAGFDKDGKHLIALSALGFGFIEVGTITPLPQPGNEKPRLFRLPKDEALINRMGFNNQGVDVLVERLKRFHQFREAKKISMAIGGNIGRNKNTPNEKAADDYLYCFEKIFDYTDYITINVSSPNTIGLRDLQNKDSLFGLLQAIKKANSKHECPKPLFVKIAPDLSKAQLDDVIEIVKELKLSGIVAANTTISRSNLKTEQTVTNALGEGGLSGKPIRSRTLEMVKYLKEKSNNEFAIIGTGGIFNAEDAKAMMNAGADLVQVYTGFIYEGPSIVKQINQSISGRST